MALAGRSVAVRFWRTPLPRIGELSGSVTTILMSGLLLQHPRDALQRAARADAGHPVIERHIGEVVEDFARGRARMNLGIGFVFELAAKEPAVPVGKLYRLGEHPLPFSEAGVSTTLAPRKRMSLRRSMLKLSAMVTTSG